MSEVNVAALLIKWHGYRNQRVIPKISSRDFGYEVVPLLHKDFNWDKVLVDEQMAVFTQLFKFVSFPELINMGVVLEGFDARENYVAATQKR